MKKNIDIARAAILAAIYVGVCLLLQPLSFGPIQFRFSEILCLPAIDQLWAFCGVVLGCFLSNLFLGGLGIIDVIFGTLATFLGCLSAYHFRNIRYKEYPLLSAFMIAFINGLIIGTELGFILNTKDLIIEYILQVFIGEITVLAIGLPVYVRIKDMDFMQ